MPFIQQSIWIRSALLFPLLFAAILCQAQWQRMKSPNHPQVSKIEKIGDVLFAESVHQIFRSTDAGRSWQWLFDGFSLFKNPADGGLYAVKDQTLEVFGSFDLGQTWQFKFTTPIEQVVPGFYGDTVFAADLTKIYRRSPAAWDTVFDTQNASVIDDVAQTGQHLWVANSGQALHSPDLGNTWLPLNFSAQSVAVLGDAVLFSWYSNDSTYLARSLDFGATWQTGVFAGPVLRDVQATDDVFFAYGNAFYPTPFHLFVSNNGLTGWDTLFVDSLNLFPHAFQKIGDTLVLASGNGAARQINGHWLFAQFPENQNLSSLHTKTLVSVEDFLLVADLNSTEGYSSDEGQTWSSSAIGRVPASVQRFQNYYLGLRGGPPHLFRCKADGYFEWDTLLPNPVRSIATIGDTLYHSDGFGRVFRSLDAGANWAQSGSGNSGLILALHGKLIQKDGTQIWESNNGGASWNPIFDFGFSLQYAGILTENERLYVYDGEHNRIYQSLDFGNSFDSIPLPVLPPNTSFLNFETAKNWLFLRAFPDTNLYIKKWDDSGWAVLKMPDSPNRFPGFPHFSDVIAANDSTFFASENNGAIWRLKLQNLRKISGCVFRDLNLNGQQDSLETGVGHVLIESQSADFWGATDASGQFAFLTEASNDVIAPVTAFPYFQYSPVSASVGIFDSSKVCFALQATAVVHDMSVNVTANKPFRPGFESAIYATASNEGTEAASGSVKLVLDPLLDVQAIEPPPSELRGDTVIWAFNDFQSLAPSKNYKVTVKTQLAQPGAGIRVFACVSIPSDSDSTDNQDVLEDIVVAAFDPNDKLASPTVVRLEKAAGAEIRYTIRFQNLGNIPTDFVSIRDTLSPLLRPETLRILGGSHPFEYRIEKPDVLVFDFNPLHLPPASTDEIGSTGFLKFSVRLKDAIAIADTVKNTAHIYFDFNPAVVTNTAQTSVAEMVRAQFVFEKRPLRVYPNPTDGMAWIEAERSRADLGNLLIFNAKGQLVFSETTTDSKKMVNLKGLPAGHYEIVWHMGEQVFLGKMVIVGH